MTVYWDSCALIWYFGQGRLAEINGITRTHTLAEVFSALTGKGINMTLPDGSVRLRKFSPKTAAEVIRRLHPKLQYHDLDSQSVVNACDSAQRKAVQGGRIHDYLHAFAAQQANTDELWTTDQNDFAGLGPVPVIVVSKQPPAKTPA